MVIAVYRVLRSFIAPNSRLAPPSAIPLILDAIAMVYCSVRLPEVNVATAVSFGPRVAMMFPLLIEVTPGLSSCYRHIQTKERLSPASASRRAGRRVLHRRISLRSALSRAGPRALVLLFPWAMAIL